jgi:hypothetical protein
VAKEKSSMRSSLLDRDVPTCLVHQRKAVGDETSIRVEHIIPYLISPNFEACKSLRARVGLLAASRSVIGGSRALTPPRGEQILVSIKMYWNVTG